MQTTLRLDDQIYRRAKSMAAELGVSLTRFLEDSLRQRIQQAAAPRRGKPIRLPVSKAGGGVVGNFRNFDEAIRAANLDADRRRAR